MNDNDVYALLRNAKPHKKNFEVRETFAPVTGVGLGYGDMFAGPKISTWKRIYYFFRGFFVKSNQLNFKPKTPLLHRLIGVAVLTFLIVRYKVKSLFGGKHGS